MPTSLADVLRQRLDPRHDPGQPLVTFYDDDSGERTELSATTYANWVAKTAGVLVEDLDLAPGDRVRFALPTHWLGPVFLGAAWLAGLEVVHHGPAELLVDGPAGAPEEAPQEMPQEVPAAQQLRCALLPFAVASREPMPAGVLDFGTLWPGQPDSFLGQPGSADDPAYAGQDQGTLLGLEGSPDRVLTDLDPLSPEGVALFVSTLVGRGSTVWIARPDARKWEHRAATEKATRTVRL